MMQSNLSYDSFVFSDNGLIVTNIGHLTLAPRENQLDKLANTNGSVLVQSQYGHKTIQVDGYYIGATSEAAQTMYDTLAAVCNRQQRNLVIPHAGLSRTYIATPGSIVIQQPDGMNRLTFSIEFVVPSGYAKNPEFLELFSETTSLSSISLPLEVAGSVNARPAISINFASVSGGDGKTVSIRNGRDMIGMTLTRDWASGDTILIDSENFQLYINGVLSAPSGRFPSWQPGFGSAIYSDTLTARTATIIGTYNAGNL